MKDFVLCMTLSKFVAVEVFGEAHLYNVMKNKSVDFGSMIFRPTPVRPMQVCPIKFASPVIVVGKLVRLANLYWANLHWAKDHRS